MITTFDQSEPQGPRDIVERLRELADAQDQMLKIFLPDNVAEDIDNIFYDAIDEIEKLRKVLGMTSN